MGLPLDGVTVIDTTSFAMGPFSSVCLADMGARVIKIENPAGGDRGRGATSVKHIPLGRYNWLFEMLNRGKESFGLDWKTEEGKKVLCKMVKSADVFMTNMKPSSLEKSGLDYETLSKINPKIIYAHCTGWGNKGPDKDVDAFDLIAYARAGLMTVQGESGAPPPKCIPGTGDTVGGMVLAYGILLALFQREKTGRGQKVEANLLKSQILMFGSGSLQGYLANGVLPKFDSRYTPANALTNSYQTKDGRWLMLSMMQGDDAWDTFAKAAGISELLNDPRFTNHDIRCKNAVALREILDKVFASGTLAEWIEKFRGYEFAWSPCQNYAEVASDPQVLENDVITSYNHPNLGLLKAVGCPVKLGEDPVQIKAPAPELGQHTEEILLQMGYGWEEISRLKAEHIIT